MKTSIAILVLALAAGPAIAQMPAGTNFPQLANYPDPQCPKPGDKPTEPRDHFDAAQVDHYNDAVRKYNVVANAYTLCMNAYVANANADMALIHDKVHAAVGGANALTGP